MGQKKLTLILAFISLICALSFRLAGITKVEAQPDEVLWVGRSAKIAPMLEQDPYNATTHLGHPGVSPAIIMALAINIRNKFVQRYNLEPGDPYHIFKLDACRIAVASVSSLIAPVVFLGSIALLGIWPAFLAAMFIALDPRHIGFSRMAHLDAVLCLLVSCTIFLYFYAQRSKSPAIKLLAGVFWGLCIATKPTAGVLLIAFLILNLFRKYLANKKVPLLSWSDLGAFLVGHLTFVLIYTRLWAHRSDYRGRLAIKSEIARAFWRSGRFLQQHPEVLATLLFLLFIATFWLIKSYTANNQHKWKYHLGMFTGLVAIFSLTLSIVPQVFENLARFWTWAAGLSKEQHSSFGHLQPPTQYGYLDLMLSEISALGLVGLVLAAYFIFRKQAFGFTRDTKIFALFMLVTMLIWLLPLNTSDKQAWRYALPIVPCIYCLAAFGIGALINSLTELKSVKFNRYFSRPALCSSSIVAIIALQLFQTYSWSPNYLVFFNPVRGGIKGALKRGQGFPFVGQNDAIDFLMKEAQSKENPSSKFITVLGGASTLELSAYRAYGPKSKELLRFGYFSPASADYVLSYSSHKAIRPGKEWAQTLQNEPIYTFSLQGVGLLYIHQVPLRDMREPLILAVSRAGRSTGKVEYRQNKSLKFIVAQPDRDQKGYLFYTHGVRLSKGDYRLKVPLKLATHVKTDQPNRELVRLNFGRCQKSIRASELSASQLKTFELACSFDKDLRIRPRVFWHGRVGVELGNLEVGRARTKD